MSNVFCIGNGVSRKDLDLEKLRPHGKIYGCNALYRTFTPDVLSAVDHGIMHEIYHSGYAYNNECWFRDWTKIPENMYDNLIYAGLSNEEVSDIKKSTMINVNEKQDSKEFVMHGASLRGLVSILHREKQKKIIEKRKINHHALSISWVKDNDKVHDLKEIMVDRSNNVKDHGWATGPSSGYIAIKKEKPLNVFMIGHDLYSNNNYVNNIYAGTKNYVATENSPTPCINWIEQWKTLFTWNPEITFFKINEFNDDRDKINSKINEWHSIKNIKYINFKELDVILGYKKHE
jgi:hypothetical protein